MGGMETRWPWLKLTEIKDNPVEAYDFQYGTIEGYITISDDSMYLPFIANSQPGNGLLDGCFWALDNHAYQRGLKYFKVPCVLSGILLRFLLINDFEKTFEYDEIFKEDVEVFKKGIRFTKTEKKK